MTASTAPVEIVYPGLACPASVAAASGRVFSGGCLSIVFDGHDPDLRHEHRLVELAVAEATARGVALLGGSSFGFNTSRIYLTAARAECGEPFVRVAAGTEHSVEVESLADALVAAVRADTLAGQGRGPDSCLLAPRPRGSSPYACAAQPNPKKNGAETWLKPSWRSLRAGASGVSWI